LLQIGSFFFLFALLIGLFVQKFPVPRLGLAVHLEALMQGLFLMVVGLLWPKLTLSKGSSLVAFCALIYGCVAGVTGNLLAGLWGAGSSLLPLAAGSATGSGFQEMMITICLKSSVPALIIAVILIIWGLRGSEEQ
jgi:hydroxylaminobenzene mutase